MTSADFSELESISERQNREAWISATRLSTWLLSFIGSSESPLTRGIYGAGVLLPQPGPRLAPVILLSEDYAPSRPSNPWDTDAKVVLGDIISTAPEKLEYLVMGVPEPLPFAAPGERIQCLGRSGVLGSFVTTSFGSPAMLTCGHVAPMVGGRVWTGADDIGTVIFSDHPSRHAPHSPAADVAVIALTDEALKEGTITAIVGARSAQANDVVTVDMVDAQRSTTVFGRLEFVTLDGGQSLHRDCYMTAHAVSSQGDSGAPVVREDDRIPGLNYLIGLVVGGSEGATTYVQDVMCQLASSRTTLYVP